MGKGPTMIEVPEDSIYFWMYAQGLKHVSLEDIELACKVIGKDIREKDVKNYWNGWYRSDLATGGYRDVFAIHEDKKKPYFEMEWSDYPIHPYLGQPEIDNRWVPCTKEGKPLYKWSQGCMSRIDAECMRGCGSLAENLKGTKMIVIDCDGDHSKDNLDYEAIMYLSKYIGITHAMAKPKKVSDYGSVPIEYAGLADMPASFHLTFAVDRVIPTMHFSKAHVDIVGNKENSLRYLKNKIWNGIEPLPMNEAIWDDIKSYVERRNND